MTIILEVDNYTFVNIIDKGQRFFIIRQNKPIAIGETILFQEKNDDTYSGKERSYELTHVYIADPKILKSNYLIVQFKEKDLNY
jgi:hypothetical protein